MRFARITANPRQMGVPCIRRLGIPVAAAVGMMADGMSETELLEACPDLEREDLAEALRYAADASARARTAAGERLNFLVDNALSPDPRRELASTRRRRPCTSARRSPGNFAPPAEKFAEIRKFARPGRNDTHLLYRPQDASTSLPLPVVPTSSLLATLRPAPAHHPPLPPLPPIRGHGVPGSHGPSEGIVNHQMVTFRLMSPRPPEPSPWRRCAPRSIRARRPSAIPTTCPIRGGCCSGPSAAARCTS